VLLELVARGFLIVHAREDVLGHVIENAVGVEIPEDLHGIAVDYSFFSMYRL
jgi:hypothetical protein